MRQVQDDENVGPEKSRNTVADMTVLDYVSHSDMYRNRLIRELTGLLITIWAELAKGAH